MKIPYFVPWITSKDINFVKKTLKQRWLTHGPILEKFENHASQFIGSDYSLGVSSATHALHLSLRALGIGPGDEVILSTFTFVATEAAVVYCGAKPVLADVDQDTFNITPEEIEKRITKKTRALIVVHYGGQSCDMEDIMEISKRRGLHVIEDCAHAFGSTFGNLKCGNIGKAGCFSFYPTKIITTGEGGMITTNDKNLFESMKLLRSHGMVLSARNRESLAKWRYDVSQIGYNYRLDEIRSSLGYSQLLRINELIKVRKKIAKEYDKRLKNIKGISIPKKASNRNHIYHLYTIKIEDDYHMTRDELIDKLYMRGIGTSVQYQPLHLMTYNKKYLKNKREFSKANYLKDRVLSLPIFPKMTIKQIETVASALH